MPEDPRVMLFRVLGAPDPEKLAAMPEEAAVEELMERKLESVGVVRAVPMKPWPKVFQPIAMVWLRFRVWMLVRRMRKTMAWLEEPPTRRDGAHPYDSP